MRRINFINRGPIPYNSLNLLVLGVTFPVNNVWDQWMLLSR